MDTFELSLIVWGYSVTGYADVSVRVSERDYEDNSIMQMWDMPLVLSLTTRNGERVPDYYALWWVCEHERRKDVGWCR